MHDKDRPLPWRILLVGIKFGILVGLVMVNSCATVSEPQVTSSPNEQIISPSLQNMPKYTLKRKVVIARFTNETMYGKSVLLEGMPSMIERQASEILHTRLAESQKFLLFEREDSARIIQALNDGNLHTLGLPADYLIVGAVTEFGRETTGKTGVFSRSKAQKAQARVNVRLVDVKTSQIIFAAEGRGEAITETGVVFGVGTHAGYDSTLNDTAISAAISKVVNNIVENLLEKPWRSYVLTVEDTPQGEFIVIGGGTSQGLAPGHRLAILRKGRIVNNPQTGMPLELPGTEVARVEVVSTFGGSPENEGSRCRIISGVLPLEDFSTYVVEEIRHE